MNRIERDEMALVLLALGFAVFIAIVVSLAALAYSRAGIILRRWAESNGYEIVGSRYCRFNVGPFFWTTSNWQYVYYVRVRLPENQERRGWVRCGGWLSGVLSDKAEVRWDE